MTTTSRKPVEPTRARYPDGGGRIEREGVRIAWDRYGSEGRAILLMPTWEIVYSRVWKCQIPFLARTVTVLTFDPRGNGRSDRPAAVAAYDRAERTRDALAVLNAAGVQRVTVVSWCEPGDDLALAVEHPDRVEALVLIAPDLLVSETPNEDRYQRLGDWPGFARAFFADAFPEPHSTKQIEDGVGWALETDAAVIQHGLDATWDNEESQARNLLARVACPTLVIQGSEDRIAGAARGPAVAAAIADSVLVELKGSGHGPHLRDPVRFNLVLREFVEAAKPRAWTTARSRHKRALYVSSPIGCASFIQTS